MLFYRAALPLSRKTLALLAARAPKLRKLRCCPWRAGQPAKAIHVLQAREANAG